MAKTNHRDLSEIRACRPPLLDERTRLQAGEWGQNESRLALASHCDSAAATFRQRLAHAAQSGDWGPAFQLRARPGDGIVDAGPLLAALLSPDVLAASLDQYVMALPPSVDPAPIAARLLAIDGELSDLDESEELAVLLLEAQGLSIGRRADADPAVVLKVRS
jgi:hypothetical protein